MAIKAEQKTPAPFPWPEVGEHTVDAIVAEAIKGSRAEARQLPLLTFYEILMDAQARKEALPAQMQFEQTESDRKTKEKAEAAKR